MKRPRLSVALFVLLLISGCTKVCNCPAGLRQISLPNVAPATVSTVTADTCSVNYAPPQSLWVSSGRGRPCTIRVNLNDGESLTTVVQFQSVGGCCSDVYEANDSSPFTHCDAGADE
jgi:hypothetical protein